MNIVEYEDHHVHEELKAIYVISVNGKSYVGQTKNTKQRFGQHAREDSGCTYLRNAILKYGPENATVEIVERDLTPEMANVMEALYVEKLGTLAPNGYNLTTGGESCVVSDVTRQKMSEISKDRWQDEEYREKHTQINKERWQDEEYRQKMSEVHKERCQDEEYKQKMSEVQKERWQDEEYREKHTQINKERWQDEEYCQKMSEIHKERCQDPEFRQNMSEIQKERWQDEDYKQKMSEIHKERCQDPEFRQNMSEIQKENWQDEDYKQKMSAISKERWQDPEFRQKRAESLKNPECIKKRNLASAKRRGRKLSEFVESYERHDGNTEKIVEELSITKQTFKTKEENMKRVYFL